ncbi:PIG-L deacetylase family protein [Paenibacillus eucommiae]|uniref:LmbE family N-acetylglucosaminyl deacetylase n=1 Tax=Paenibacillus eucommiae TaxID=1355755 RepID=A0ABS4IXT9_9BACL|nr:PIG-L family deacetylase [Paenibacillus eucommiae]MBP1992338.1 LmbE family N-acetylglucosaminyl deacetylase [Paenibacillus eucommiae]
MNVLAIGCHPDDLEIGCGGTLAKLSQLGHNVTMCNVANGNKGHVIIQPEELKQIRAEEAQASGRLIGAKVVNLDVPDLYVRADNEDLLKAMITLIRETKPDFIITHNPDDYMSDHEEVSKLVFDASFSSSVPHMIPDVPAYAKIAPIYYMDTLAGVNFLPTEYVDITDTLDIKLEMLNAHQSQIAWLKEHDDIDFLEFVKSCSRFRGLQSGVKYAEGFRMCQSLHRMTTKRYLP